MFKTVGLVFPRLLSFAIIALAFSLSLDLISTYIALASGYAYEGNPLAAHLLASGFGSLILLKLLGVAVSLILSIYVVRSKQSGLLRFYTLSLLAIALFYFLLSLSNLSAAYFHHDFFTTLLRLIHLLPSR